VLDRQRRDQKRPGVSKSHYIFSHVGNFPDTLFRQFELTIIYVNKNLHCKFHLCGLFVQAELRCLTTNADLMQDGERLLAFESICTTEANETALARTKRSKPGAGSAHD
jgi:hypothetical protein